MILEYRVNELELQAAWLKTLYELIEELNCKCKTHIDESYNKVHQNFGRTRVIKIYGNDTMLGWLQLRMERYLHFISVHNSSIDSTMHNDSDIA